MYPFRPEEVFLVVQFKYFVGYDPYKKYSRWDRLLMFLNIKQPLDSFTVFFSRNDFNNGDVIDNGFSKAIILHNPNESVSEKFKRFLKNKFKWK